MNKERTLQAYLQWCGDSCRCVQVVVEEVSPDGSRLPLHEGTFLSDPSRWEEEDLLEELREVALKHRLEQVDDGLWERAI